MNSISLGFVLLAIVFVAAESEDSCEPWPSELKSLKECCTLPVRLMCPSEVSCAKECSEENVGVKLDDQSASVEDVDKMRKCIEDCFIKLSYLMENKTTKINKKMARKLYHSNHPFIETWIESVENSVEKCELGSSESFSTNLAEFFNCVDVNLIKRCDHVQYHIEGCEKVEEHLQKCRNIQPNCTEWPVLLFKPKHCCIDPPPLLNDDLVKKCYENCDAIEYFRQFAGQCVHKCLYEETKITTAEDSKFDFEIVKKLLVENSNKTVDWTSAIDFASQECEKLILSTCDKLLIAQFQILISIFFISKSFSAFQLFAESHGGEVSVL